METKACSKTFHYLAFYGICGRVLHESNGAAMLFGVIAENVTDELRENKEVLHYMAIIRITNIVENVCSLISTWSHSTFPHW